MADGKNSGRKIIRRARFGVNVSAWRLQGFVLDVSARTFRRGAFGTVVSATSNCLIWFRNDKLSSLESTHCPLWKAHIVLFGKHTLSSMGTTPCPLWKAHIVLCGNHTMSSLETKHCPLWKTHFVFCGKHTMSPLERIHRLLWKQQILLCENKKYEIKF